MEVVDAQPGSELGDRNRVRITDDRETDPYAPVATLLDRNWEPFSAASTMDTIDMEARS